MTHNPLNLEFSAANLSRVLRDKSLWPEGFVWNYGDCRSCALGLSRAIFGTGYGTRKLSQSLGLSEDDAEVLFFKAHLHLRGRGTQRWMMGVTADDVAVVLDDLMPQPRKRSTETGMAILRGLLDTSPVSEPSHG